MDVLRYARYMMNVYIYDWEHHGYLTHSPVELQDTPDSDNTIFCFGHFTTCHF